MSKHRHFVDVLQEKCQSQEVKVKLGQKHVSFVHSSQHSLATGCFLRFMIHAPDLIPQGYDVPVHFPEESLSAEFTYHSGSHISNYGKHGKKNLCNHNPNMQGSKPLSECIEIRLLLHVLFKCHPLYLEMQ